MVLPPKQINIEVAYAAGPERQRIIILRLPEGSTVEIALDRSGLIMLFPEIDFTTQSIGIFGKIKKMTDLVAEGDRIEVYRPLMVDPKEARKKRFKYSKPRVNLIL